MISQKGRGQSARPGLVSSLISECVRTYDLGTILVLRSRESATQEKLLSLTLLVLALLVVEVEVELR